MARLIIASNYMVLVVHSELSHGKVSHDATGFPAGLSVAILKRAQLSSRDLSEILGGFYLHLKQTRQTEAMFIADGGHWSSPSRAIARR